MRKTLVHIRSIILALTIIAACDAVNETSEEIEPAGDLSAVDAASSAGYGPVPSYPNWPPEVASSTMRLTPLLSAYEGVSLFEISEKITQGLISAGYSDYSLYTAPGGFIAITRIEAMDSAGNTISGAARFKLPSQSKAADLSLLEQVRNLFLDAPPGYYRMMLFVITDEAYVLSKDTLSESEAIERLRGGAQVLGHAYQDLPFTAQHTADVLIYEFALEGKETEDRTIKLLQPSLVDGQTHLRKTDIGVALASTLGGSDLGSIFTE